MKGPTGPGNSDLSDERLSLLDAYSQAVVGVVEKVRPAVVSINSDKPGRLRLRGGGRRERLSAPARGLLSPPMVTS